MEQKVKDKTIRLIENAAISLIKLNEGLKMVGRSTDIGGGRMNKAEANKKAKEKLDKIKSMIDE